MPDITFSIQADGFSLDAFVGLDGTALQKLVAQGLPRPRPVSIRGYIDTGSDATAVSPRVLNILGVPAGAEVIVQTAGGQVQVATYEVSVGFYHPVTGAVFAEPYLLVTELTVPLAHEVLIGLDLILLYKWAIDGPARLFTFSF